MITERQCLDKFGVPELESSMTLLRFPKNLIFHPIPSRIYCNKLLKPKLIRAIRNAIERNLTREIKSWDGCFNIRKSKGNKNKYSLHSWGVAIDINAETNGYGEEPQMSAELVKCFTDAGFEWGGNWAISDGMHMQLASL